MTVDELEVRLNAIASNTVNTVGSASSTVVIRAIARIDHWSTTSGRIRNAAVEGYRTMVEGVVNVVLFLLSYGPSLLLWGGLLFFPVRSVLNRLRRSPAQ